MKTTKILFLLLFFSIGGLASPSYAKSVKGTASFSVSGNCDQCKMRIETGAKNGGASKANWNTETKIIKVAFDPAKTTPDKIQQSIANTGYDTEKYPASSEAYQKLPHCCQYTKKE